MGDQDVDGRIGDEVVASVEALDAEEGQARVGVVATPVAKAVPLVVAVGSAPCETSASSSAGADVKNKLEVGVVNVVIVVVVEDVVLVACHASSSGPAITDVEDRGVASAPFDEVGI